MLHDYDEISFDTGDDPDRLRPDYPRPSARSPKDGAGMRCFVAWFGAIRGVVGTNGGRA